MASGLAVEDDSRGTTVRLLLRRCAKIAVVAVHRTAGVGWHIAARRVRPGNVDLAGSAPREFRLALEELGTTFVKIGQLLSTRPDIAPAPLQRELSKLQDHAPSIPRAVLLEELERSLGPGSTDLFARLEMVPAACGSIAQVHRATLHDGRRVAVKVRRPGVLADIEADLWLLHRLARLIARLSSRVRAYDPVAILGEFSTLLLAETDFILEASNIEAVGRTFAANTTVTIPRVVTDMSRDSILVMDWIEGIPLADRESLEEVAADRAGLARTILQAYGVMIFQSDRFQADPHPGNLIAMKGSRLGLVDFGEVGSVNPGERSALLKMVTAVVGRDGEGLAAAVLSVSRTTRTVDYTEFGAQLKLLLGSVADVSLKDLRLGEAFGHLLHLLRQNGIVLPSDLAVLIKTLIECESTTNELDSTMSMINLVGELGSLAPAPGTTSGETPNGREQDKTTG